jgi:hypothetical protein
MVMTTTTYDNDGGRERAEIWGAWCGPPNFLETIVYLFYISTSSELSNNKPTIWSRGSKKS